jgi:hypothetical protein
VTVSGYLQVTGSATLAGVMVKFSAVERLRWQCEVCGGYGNAHPPQGFVYGDTCSGGEAKT